MEGFRTAFPENEGLADKLYKFVKSQGQQFDFEALLLTSKVNNDNI